MLTVAVGRCAWQLAITRWADTGSLDCDVVAVVSVPHALAHLSGSRRFQAVIVDGAVVDNTLVELVERAGCPLVSVGTPACDRVGAQLSEPFGPDELTTLLQRVGRPLGSTDSLPSFAPCEERGGPGALVAVIGGNGSGTTTAAQALAQYFGTRLRTALVDGSRHADLGAIHGSLSLGPGLLELAADCDTPDTRSFLHYVAWANYDLLLGLRRPTDWALLAPGALERTLSALLRDYEAVICDVDPELDGEADSGSYDMAERHALSRLVIEQARVIVVTTRATLVGGRRLVATLGAIEEQTPELPAIIVCATGARGRRDRQRARRELAELLDPRISLVCWEYFDADQGHRTRCGLPRSPVASLGAAVATALDHAAAADACPTGERRRSASTWGTVVGRGDLGDWGDG